MKTNNFHRYSRKGFTLVELLTVIAIIGILAAIIIPITGSVRRSALKTKSLSNMRQITPAFLLYAADNKGLLPRAAHGGDAGNPDPSTDSKVNPSKGFWFHELTPYVGGKLADEDLNADGRLISPRNSPAAKFFNEPIWGSLLGYDPVQYAIDNNLADIRIGYTMNGEMGYAVGEENGGYNSPTSTRNMRTHLKRYTEPSRTIILAYGFYEGFTVNRTTGQHEQLEPWAPDNSGGPVDHFLRIGADSSGRNGTSGAFGFLDGSVRVLRPSETAPLLKLRNN